MKPSKAKQADKALRETVLKIAQSCIKRGNIKDAQFFTAESSRLKKRMETHDYRYEDAEYAVVDALDARWSKITEGAVHAPKTSKQVWESAFNEWDRSVNELFMKSLW